MTKKSSIKPKNCIDCGKEYLPTGPRQLRCNSCKEINTKEVAKAYHKANYVRKGYNQFGEANNNWTGGIGIYTRYLTEITSCQRCGGQKNLLIHHKDRDRHNNTPDNLEKMCRKCHSIEHGVVSNLPDAEYCGMKRSEWIKNHPECIGADGQFTRICKV